MGIPSDPLPSRLQPKSLPLPPAASSAEELAPAGTSQPSQGSTAATQGARAPQSGPTQVAADAYVQLEAGAAPAQPRVGLGRGPQQLDAEEFVSLQRTAATAPPFCAEPVNYSVQPGESLWSIASQKLGDPASWPELYAMNRQAIDRLAQKHGCAPDPQTGYAHWIFRGESLSLCLPAASSSSTSGPGSTAYQNRVQQFVGQLRSTAQEHGIRLIDEPERVAKDELGKLVRRAIAALTQSGALGSLDKAVQQRLGSEVLQELRKLSSPHLSLERIARTIEKYARNAPAAAQQQVGVGGTAAQAASSSPVPRVDADKVEQNCRLIQDVLSGSGSKLPAAERSQLLNTYLTGGQSPAETAQLVSRLGQEQLRAASEALGPEHREQMLAALEKTDQLTLSKAAASWDPKDKQGIERLERAKASVPEWLARSVSAPSAQSPSADPFAPPTSLAHDSARALSSFARGVGKAAVGALTAVVGLGQEAVEGAKVAWDDHELARELLTEEVRSKAEAAREGGRIATEDPKLAADLLAEEGMAQARQAASRVEQAKQDELLEGLGKVAGDVAIEIASQRALGRLFGRSDDAIEATGKKPKAGGKPSASAKDSPGKLGSGSDTIYHSNRNSRQRSRLPAKDQLVRLDTQSHREPLIQQQSHAARRRTTAQCEIQTCAAV